MVPALTFESVLQRGTAAWNEIKLSQREYVGAFDGQLRLKVLFERKLFFLLNLVRIYDLRYFANVLAGLRR